jgi:hypothetical protein
VAFRPGEPHLVNLREVVVTVLRYAEARGDMSPGELELEEVIDAFDESKDRGPEDFRSRLVWFCANEIKRAVKRRQRTGTRRPHRRGSGHSAGGVHNEAGRGHSVLLPAGRRPRAEDLIPDLDVPAPDAIAESEELPSCVRNSLRELPEDAPRADNALHHWGFAGRSFEVSREIRKRSETTIEDARARLREDLVAAGCTFGAEALRHLPQAAGRSRVSRRVSSRGRTRSAMARRSAPKMNA